MAAVESRPATNSAAPPRLDLKWSLMLRVVAVVFICFLAAATLALFGTYREVRQVNKNVADFVVGQMRDQLALIGSNPDAMANFPDWDPVTEVAQGTGQCVRYVKPDGGFGRSSCIGFNSSIGIPPAWFAGLCDWLGVAQVDVTLPISYRNRTYGTLVVTTEPAVVVASIWRKVSVLLGFTALVIGAICLLQYVAITRALRPTRRILAGLDRLARGDLSARLPSFRLKELQHISEAFNTLAANLDRTTREKMELATRLVDAQEQERLNLARDLHDELAQNLGAISAIAASIKATAETECTTLVPEANRLSQTAIAIMKSLRSTLRALRPPEIEDLGLAASLSALAMDQERRAGGGLHIALEIDDDLHRLPPTAASHVYRIVQEGLTNITKHANASRARVALGFRGEPVGQAASERRGLDITIEDDGRGLVEGGAPEDRDGLGLIGMRERVMALGGQLDASPNADGGFRLHAIIPIDAETRGAS